MWDNLKELDEGEIDFSREEWYSKIFDIKAPGLCSIYSVKKSGKGKSKLKVQPHIYHSMMTMNFMILLEKYLMLQLTGGA